LSSQTVYATKTAGGNEQSSIDGSNKAMTSVDAGTDSEPTTTITDRSTTTRTVTIETVDASGGEYGSPETSVAGVSASATGSGCAAMATVTQTIKSTVTVVSLSNHHFLLSPLTISQTAGASTAVAPEASSTEDAGSAMSTSSMPILSTSSAAPYTNGTAVHPTKPKKKKCASSGFLTKSKPTTLPSGYKRS
jgi:hypothetical protein